MGSGYLNGRVPRPPVTAPPGTRSRPNWSNAPGVTCWGSGTVARHISSPYRRDTTHRTTIDRLCRLHAV